MAAGSGEYDRGVTAGEIGARLAGHDEHFAEINGQLGRLADEMSGVRLQLQRLADGITSNLATVATTATAVEKERDQTAQAVERQRRVLKDATEQRWSPLTRVGLAAGALAAIGGIVALVVSLIH